MLSAVHQHYRWRKGGFGPNVLVQSAVNKSAVSSGCIALIINILLLFKLPGYLMPEVLVSFRDEPCGIGKRAYSGIKLNRCFSALMPRHFQIFPASPARPMFQTIIHLF